MVIAEGESGMTFGVFMVYKRKRVNGTAVVKGRDIQIKPDGSSRYYDPSTAAKLVVSMIVQEPFEHVRKAPKYSRNGHREWRLSENIDVQGHSIQEGQKLEEVRRAIGVEVSQKPRYRPEIFNQLNEDQSNIAVSSDCPTPSNILTPIERLKTAAFLLCVAPTELEKALSLIKAARGK